MVVFCPRVCKTSAPSGVDSTDPENASLAKEEVAKLDDIQSQLKEQEKSLQAQHKDADELVKLKEEQIKLLEAQLAAQ